jgi:uncharacterized membrane protein YeiH
MTVFSQDLAHVASLTAWAHGTIGDMLVAKERQLRLVRRKHATRLLLLSAIFIAIFDSSLIKQLSFYQDRIEKNLG